MANRAGTAESAPSRRAVPGWLADRMTRLGAVDQRGDRPPLRPRRVAAAPRHPFWFQSFGAVMGMDWHSSGITTSVIGALKRGLAPSARRTWRFTSAAVAASTRGKTPDELVAIGERVGFDGSALANGEPSGRQGRQRRRAGRFPPLPARLHRHRRRPLGGRPAGHERGAEARLAATIGFRKGCRVSSTSRTLRSTESGRARSSTSPIAGQKPLATASSSSAGRGSDGLARARWLAWRSGSDTPAVPHPQSSFCRIS